MTISQPASVKSSALPRRQSKPRPKVHRQNRTKTLARRLNVIADRRVRKREKNQRVFEEREARKNAGKLFDVLTGS